MLPNWSSWPPCTGSPTWRSPPPAGSADDRDLFDMFEFQRAAADLLSAEITVYSDGALRNDHVSPDLAAATPL